MNRLRYSLLPFVFLVAGTNLVWGQWNAIAGYEISSADADPFNVLLQAFNQKYANTVAFKDIKVLNGFNAGLRYNYPLGAFEMVYNRRFTRRIGDQFAGIPGIVSKTDLSNADFFYEIRTYSLMSELGGGLRVGASLDYNTYLTEMR